MANESNRSVETLAVCLAVWLLARQYSGVWHDAKIYALQAMNARAPMLYERDLFFLGKLQAGYSLFPELLGQAMDVFGLGNAAMVLSFVSVLAFFGACASLLAALVPAPQRWAGLLVLATFPHLYGANQHFAFAEPFLTARSWAEPFCLLGLAAVLRGQWWFAVPAFAVAAAFHPLMVLPCLGAMVVFLVIGERWFLVIPALGLVLLVALWHWQVGPFSELFTRVDSRWLESLSSDPTVFLSEWNWSDWNVVVFDTVVLLGAARRLDGRSRRLAYSVLATMGAGLAATAILAGVLHLVLPMQIQFWRALWISHCLAMGLLPWLALELYRAGDRLSASLLCLGLVAIPYPGGALATLLALITAAEPVSRILSRPGGLKAEWFVFVVIGLLSLPALGELIRYAVGNAQFGLPRRASWLFSIPLAGFLLGAALRTCVGRMPRFPGLVLSLGFLSGAACLWDFRDDAFRREVEDYSSATRIFPAVGGGAQVLWYGNPLAVWTLVQAPSYYSPIQCAGLVFSRELTEECRRRATGLLAFEAVAEACAGQAELLQREVACVPDARTLHALCIRFPDLDFVVLPGNVGGWGEAAWKPSSQAQATEYHLHRCATVRESNMSIGEAT